MTNESEGELLRIQADGATLAVHRSSPGSSGPHPAVVLVHGYPSFGAPATHVAASLWELADRVAAELGWLALAPSLRGCGMSTGDFSLSAWRADVQAVVDLLTDDEGVSGVWLAGLGTGGALAIVVGAEDPTVRGVAALAAPADFDDWSKAPRRLEQHARDIGIITSPPQSRSPSAFVRSLRRIRPVDSASDLAPRSLLVIHGSDDDLVPSFDARVIADAHGSAELRIINGATHQLRHDPRSLAILLGWLDRQKHHMEES